MNEDDIVFDASKVPARSEEAAPKGQLGLLAKALAEDIRKPDLTLTVPGREGISVVYDTNLTIEQIEMWRKACRNKKFENNFDSLKFACALLANKSKAILLNGEAQTNELDETLNLRSPEIHELLGVSNFIGHTGSQTIEAVKKLYGYDGHIMNASGELLTAAGFDNEDDEQDSVENPIQPS